MTPEERASALWDVPHPDGCFTDCDTRGKASAVEAIAGAIRSAIVEQRELVLREIEEKLPDSKTWNTMSFPRMGTPLCDKYDCEARLYEVIAKIRGTSK